MATTGRPAADCSLYFCLLAETWRCIFGGGGHLCTASGAPGGVAQLRPSLLHLVSSTLPLSATGCWPVPVTVASPLY